MSKEETFYICPVCKQGYSDYILHNKNMTPERKENFRFTKSSVILHIKARAKTELFELFLANATPNGASTPHAQYIKDYATQRISFDFDNLVM